MAANTHANTRQVRLPIRTHVRLHLLASMRGITVSTLVDAAIAWWLEKQDRHDLLEATAHLHQPKHRVPALSTWDPTTEENPPTTRHIRLPMRSHARLMALATERSVFASRMLDDIMEAYGRRMGTGDIIERTAHLPEPSRLVARDSAPPYTPPADRVRPCVKAGTWHVPVNRQRPTVCGTKYPDSAPTDVRAPTCTRCRAGLNEHGSVAAVRRKATDMGYYADGEITDDDLDTKALVAEDEPEIDVPLDDGEHEVVEA